MRKSIATHYRSKILENYQILASRSEYSPDSVSAGRRSLRNVLLGYLSLGESIESNEIVNSQFQEADNMTDRFAALACAVFDDHSGAKEMLESYFQQFESSKLAVDKWFAVQAMAPSTNTLEIVEKLMQHPAFSWENPNDFVRWSEFCNVKF